MRRPKERENDDEMRKGKRTITSNEVKDENGKEEHRTSKKNNKRRE